MGDLDRHNLAEEFELEDVEQQITTFRQVLNEVKEVEEPDKLLMATIEKAAHFLDMVEHEAANGAMSARYMEVAANLIQSITQATNSITTNRMQELERELKKMRVKQKDRELDQKDEELKLKEAYLQGKSKGGGEQNNNIIVTDRESVLEFLKGNREREIGGEQKKQLGEDNTQNT